MSAPQKSTTARHESGHQSEREPVFAYVTHIDPALSTFGWKIVGLAHLAMLLPILGAFLPRDAPVEWDWVGVVIALVVVIGAINVVSFNAMVRSKGYKSPPALLVLAEILLATIAAGVLAYAVGGIAGIYRPLVFVPTLLMAMIGNRWMILASWAVATASVALSAVASGAVDQEVVALVMSYGVVWGITAVMVHLLAVAALHSDDQVAGLGEVAGIAARANSLGEGLAEVLAVITPWAGATRAAAFRVTYDGVGLAKTHHFELLAEWPPVDARDDRGGPVASSADRAPNVDNDPELESELAATGVSSPTVAELDQARVRLGVALRDQRAVLVAEGAEGDVVAVVLEGMSVPSYDQLMARFNLERMVMQIDVLVNRSRYIARLEDLGRTDGLTGLANRRTLFEHLENACAAARRRDEPLAVVMTDLDHFKDFNDSFGHLAGDDLLRGFAAQLHERLRSVDFVARYGGEEFVLVLPDTDGPGAQALLDKMHRRLRDVSELAGVTFSAGIAVWDGHEDLDGLINRADRALYVAKAAGRDRTILDLPVT